MDSSWDLIIVGAGIAGACAAAHCSGNQRVLVIEADAPGAGASGAAAGLVNPFMGRRARPVWRLEEALEALLETLTLSGAQHTFVPSGVLRVPRTSEQAETYKKRTQEYPARTHWWSPEEASEKYPDFQTPYGALLVRSGGFVRTRKAITQMLTFAQTNNAELMSSARVTNWGEDSNGAYVTVDNYTRLHAKRVVLAVGAGFEQFPALKAMGLRGVKGQTVTVERPPALKNVPSVSGYGYVAADTDRLVLGSTYEHEYTHPNPSAAQTQKILKKVAKMFPEAAKLSVVEERAGVRVMTPHTNKAMLGPLPGSKRVWFFGGLGSKGLLMAPLMARRLPQWLTAPEAIPALLRPDSTGTT